MIRFPSLALGASLLLAGCASRPPVVPVAVAEPAPPPAPPARPELSPVLATVAVPPRLADGGFDTPNHDLDPEVAAWHLRSALNVAALACRGPEGPAIVAAYNTMLKSEAAPLAAAEQASKVADRARFGANWQDAHDKGMTRLYNYFALPPAHDGLCAAAARLAPEAAATAPAAFVSFAQTALPAIEAPILAVYTQVADTRLAIAEWDRRYGPTAPPAQAVATSTAPTLSYAEVSAARN